MIPIRALVLGTGRLTRLGRQPVGQPVDDPFHDFIGQPVRRLIGWQVRVVDRGTKNIKAYDAFLRGERLRLYSNFRVFDKAEREYDEAISLDPEFAAAYAGLGHITLDLSLYSPDHASNQREGWDRALALARKSLRLADISLGHTLLARYYLNVKFDHSSAESEARKAVEIDSNDVEAAAVLAKVLLFTDQYDETIALLEEAMRLNPGFPERYRYLIGQAKFHQGKFDASLEAMSVAS